MEQLKFFAELFPYVCLVIYFIWALIYVLKARRQPEQVNKYLLEMIPQIFTTIGIFGTFIGIAVGLFFFDVTNIEGSIPTLLGGLRTAFFASIVGIALYFVFTKWIARIQKKNEYGRLSPEAVILNKLVDSLDGFRLDMIRIMTSNDDSNNQATTGNLLREINEESKKQSAALQTFSTDLALQMTAGFEEIFNNPNRGVVHELQGLRTEIESLGNKLKDPTTEMTQNVVKDLEAALERMVAEFKSSVSGSAKAEMEGLAKLLSQASGTLTSFPATLQAMTDGLKEDFGQLQKVVGQISEQTLQQSTSASAEMTKRLDESAEQMRIVIQGLQAGQGTLVEKQEENLHLSDRLLGSFNITVTQMDALTKGINQTISNFSGVERGLANTANELNSISSNVTKATREFGIGQQKFSVQSDQFLLQNKANLEGIEASLSKAKEVSTDFADKFGIIQRGLNSIFLEIQTGLDTYSSTINENLAGYLDKYSQSMTNAVQSLAGATEQQREVLEDLAEELNKFSSRKL